jgi:nicotinamide mononucleotide adenylyltransferase
MLQIVLAGRENYTLVPVPDLDDGPRWRLQLLDLFGPLDCFVTANPYVARLMKDDYPVLRPVMLVPEAERVAVEGRMVRRAMAHGDDWQALVPPEIAAYIVSRGLDERFRREFGLETLAMETLT